MISGFLGRVPEPPKPILFILWDTRILQIIQEAIPNHSSKGSIFENLKIMELMFVSLGKDMGRTIPKTRLICFEHLDYGINLFQKARNGLFGNLGYGINIFQKIWNANLAIWEQQLFKNMKWILNRIWNFETKKSSIWDQYLSKAWMKCC